MPFPTIDPAIETFLEPTRIFLFGKRFPTLTYNAAPMNVAETEEFDSNPPAPAGPVERALIHAEAEGIFARIYGFSFEGHYYKLPRPVLFLVRGPGRSRSPEPDAAAGETGFSTRFTGVEARDWEFGSDIRVWAVDKHDIAVCLDIEVGSYDEVLLQSLAAASDEGAARDAAGFRGKVVGAAGFRGKIIGAHHDR
jgi:hypothetical protein